MRSRWRVRGKIIPPLGETNRIAKKSNISIREIKFQPSKEAAEKQWKAFI